MFQSFPPTLCGCGCYELSPPVWITCTFLNCTTQVHSWPVNGHASYQVPQFILLYSSGCGSVQFKRSWPCDTQDLNPRLCQSRELARNMCQAEGEKQACVVCRWHGAALLKGFAFPRHGGDAVLWQLHPQLPTSAAPEGECLSPSVCAGCTEPLTRYIHTVWPDLWWLVGNVTAGAVGSSGIAAFSEVVSGQAGRPQHRWLLSALYLLSLKERRLTESVYKNSLQWMCRSTAIQCPMV